MNRDQGSNISTIYGTILQPHRNEAANNSATTDEGTRMGSESFAKLSTNCWCLGIFFAIELEWFP